MSKKSKQADAEKKLEEAIKNATIVSNDINLKTALGKKALTIISTDPELYARLLKKVPKEQVSVGSKLLGKVLVGLGAAITIMSFGAFSFIGIPIAGAGAVLGAAGIVLDDFKDYSILLDYDEKRVIFFKVKGSPHIELPRGINLKKFSK